jgi:hypothetical protein
MVRGSLMVGTWLFENFVENAPTGGSSRLLAVNGSDKVVSHGFALALLVLLPVAPLGAPVGALGFFVLALPLILVMRTSPRWTHRRYGLSQVAIRPQLSYHITLGFSRHIIIVLVITLSYDIKTGRSWMCWKGVDAAIVLDLVPALEVSWIILCDHVKVLRHLFGLTWPCIVSGLKPMLWAPNLWLFPTLGRVLDYKHSRRHC